MDQERLRRDPAQRNFAPYRASFACTEQSSRVQHKVRVYNAKFTCTERRSRVQRDVRVYSATFACTAQSSRVQRKFHVYGASFTCTAQSSRVQRKVHAHGGLCPTKGFLPNRTPVCPMEGQPRDIARPPRGARDLSAAALPHSPSPPGSGRAAGAPTYERAPDLIPYQDAHVYEAPYDIFRLFVSLTTRQRSVA